ncbi:hypothetical protein MU1_04880 [Paenibacillus glycanilyticus]|uniref:Uncharacterized protein n=1 Tax=Paenibacillus glycanilyticus TaxID=126569 RepID=A0ABQ6G5A3_9BACL|nr:hypothetical protein MU1_04880 [Paenibacillus glycanilyticus]
MPVNTGVGLFVIKADGSFGATYSEITRLYFVSIRKLDVGFIYKGGAYESLRVINRNVSCFLVFSRLQLAKNELSRGYYRLYSK